MASDPHRVRSEKPWPRRPSPALFAGNDLGEERAPGSGAGRIPAARTRRARTSPPHAPISTTLSPPGLRGLPFKKHDHKPSAARPHLPVAHPDFRSEHPRRERRTTPPFPLPVFPFPPAKAFSSFSEPGPDLLVFPQRARRGRSAVCLGSGKEKPRAAGADHRTFVGQRPSRVLGESPLFHVGTAQEN